MSSPSISLWLRSDNVPGYDWTSLTWPSSKNVQGLVQTRNILGLVRSLVQTTSLALLDLIGRPWPCSDNVLGLVGFDWTSLTLFRQRPWSCSDNVNDTVRTTSLALIRQCPWPCSDNVLRIWPKPSSSLSRHCPQSGSDTVLKLSVSVSLEWARDRAIWFMPLSHALELPQSGHQYCGMILKNNYANCYHQCYSLQQVVGQDTAIDKNIDKI